MNKTLYPAGQFPALATERLCLREARIDQDGEGLLAVYRDTQVTRYCGIHAFSDITQVKEQFDWFDSVNHQAQGVRWGIFDKESNTFMGDLGFHDYDHNHRKAELGYKLGRQYWRQGFSSEAIRIVLAYGFEQMGLNRVEALVDPRNDASLGLLAHLGFQVEGRLRDYEYEKREYENGEHEQGEYVDVVILSLLKREWQTR